MQVSKYFSVCKYVISNAHSSYVPGCECNHVLSCAMNALEDSCGDTPPLLESEAPAHAPPSQHPHASVLACVLADKVLLM